MNDYLVIANPVSGRGRAPHVARRVLEGIGHGRSTELALTSRKGDAGVLASEAVGVTRRIVAVGGDGTLNEVVGGLVATGMSAEDLPEVTFVAAGTGNAACRGFSFAARRGLAAADWKRPSRAVDVGRTEYEGGTAFFLLWCGVGLDAAFIHAMDAHRPGTMGLPGLLRRAPALVGSLLERPRGAVETDEGRFETVVVANVGQIAFLGSFSASADPGDGRFNVVGLPHVRRARLPGLVVSTLLRDLASFGLAREWLAANLRLSVDSRVPAHVDGEPLPSPPTSVVNLPRAVRLF